MAELPVNLDCELYFPFEKVSARIFIVTHRCRFFFLHELLLLGAYAFTIFENQTNMSRKWIETETAVWTAMKWRVQFEIDWLSLINEQHR